MLRRIVTCADGLPRLNRHNQKKEMIMAINALKYTTHEGVLRTVPLDTVRLIRPLTDEDKERAKESLKEKRGIDIDPARVSIRIEFGDKSSKLARENLEGLRAQGIALVNMGSERYVPAANITGAESFTKEDADRLKEEDYTLSQNFRAKVDTKAGTVLSSATPQQVMDRRAKALEAANSNTPGANVKARPT
ncbi:hypothetical protein [Hyphomicrobium sp.]|uniref:hypothetical protein n=1 Tax=Hyphomicrobium sp. TaxID=82 RepID=UPI002FE41ECB